MNDDGLAIEFLLALSFYHLQSLFTFSLAQASSNGKGESAGSVAAISKEETERKLNENEIAFLDFFLPS